MKALFLIFCIVALGSCYLPPISEPPYNPPTYINPPPENGYTPPPEEVQTHASNTEGIRTQVFPYDLIFDTMAHMNCPGDANPTDPIFFSFKMASYLERGGLRLSDEFQNETKNLNFDQRKRALKASPFYSSTAQLALSHVGRPETPINFSGHEGVQSLFSFGHPHIVDTLIEHNVAYSLGNGARLELQVPLPGALLFQYASILGGSHALTLTYNNGTSQLPLRKGQNLFYGKTYTFEFDGYEQTRKDFLIDVRETNLLTNQEDGAWSCPKSLSFAIYRHPQLTSFIYEKNKKLFDKEAVDTEDVCEEKNILSKRSNQVMKALLPDQTFIIGRSKNSRKACIQPVDYRQDCYAGQQAARVEFGEDCSNLDQFNKCPAYLSVCLRR